MRPNRIYTEFIDGVKHQHEVSYSWSFIRSLRDAELAATDWWGVKDLVMSQAKKDYRIFLRDLPQNYEDANDAADAWDAYEIPE